MKSLIICQSVHNGNTRKIAQAMNTVLDAKIVKPGEVDITTLEQYDLIGFGVGIYNFQHHKALLKLADRLPNISRKAFIFSTKAMFPMALCHKKLKEMLQAKGFQIVGEFSCFGLTTFGPAKLFGGVNKGHPNAQDLENVQTFAQSLKEA